MIRRGSVGFRSTRTLLAYTAAVLSMAIVCQASGLALSAAKPAFKVIPLTMPAGYTYPTVTAMNGAGYVVGSVEGKSGAQVFEWSPVTKKVTVLALPSGAISASAGGINDVGLIAAWAYTKNYKSTVPYVIHIVNGKPTWIQLPGSGSTKAYANTHGIDNQNEVAGSYCANSGCSPYLAVMWRYVGTSLRNLSSHSWKAVLNPLPKGATNGVAWSVSHGIKAGYVTDSKNNIHPALWDDTGKSPKILTLARPLGARTAATQTGQDVDNAVDKLGNVEDIVTAETTGTTSQATGSEIEEEDCNIDGYNCYEVWRYIVKMTGDPELADAFMEFFFGPYWDYGTRHASTTPFVVGVGSAKKPVCVTLPACAVIFETSTPPPKPGTKPKTPINATATVVDLNTMIASNSGWSLTSAAAINGKHDIAGVGTYDSTTEAYLLTPAG